MSAAKTFLAAVDIFADSLDRFNKIFLYPAEKLEPYMGFLIFLSFGAFCGYILSKAYNLLPSELLTALGAVFGFFAYVVVKFLISFTPLVIAITGTVLVIPIVPFLIKFLHNCIIDISNPNFKLDVKLMVITVSLGCLVGCLILIYKLPDFLKRLFSDKDQQPHFLFLLSMVALGWGLWLQNGGDWRGMAVMNAPIVVPVIHWEIPFTESVALPFALFGFVHDPTGSAVSTVAHASLNTTLALFSGAAVLFFFAVNRLQFSLVGVRPEQAWLAFALGCAAVYLDVALHWAGAPVLPFILILFNRAVAVLALGVYLFWRTNAKRGLPVPGVTNEYKAAFEMADQSALKIAAWLLGLLWAATQFSHGWGGEFPEWVKTVLIGLLVAFPVREAVKFNSEFRNALGRYNQLAALYQQSYKPPSTVATDAQIRDALNGGRGIGGQGIDGKGWNDTGD